MNALRNILTCSALMALTGCGGGSKNNAVRPAPAAAQLSLPADNSACLSGTNVTSTESTVSFSWKGSANTDSYQITIKNLLSGASVTMPSSKTSISVSLLLNTPYSWFITSKSATSAATASSDTWKFYNSGPGTTSYAPFPATIIFPARYQMINAPSGYVTLKWSGSDVDNDLTGYDIYFGTDSTPPLLKSGLDADSLKVAVSGTTTYQWKIISKDSKGNTSDSGISTFTTE